MKNGDREDDVFAALAVVILLIGTATGSAMVLLAMSVVLLTAMLLLCRFRL